MQLPEYKELLDAGVHFGHLKRKWNPNMRRYIFMERKGIHIVDLNQTIKQLEVAGKVARNFAKSGKSILFVATKKQARDIVANAAREVNMPYITDRWLGGMLTNFSTIRRSIRKMQSIEKMLQDGTLDNVTKKERLTLTREKDKMKKVLGGIEKLNRVPAAMFVIDIVHEHLAIAEANKLGIKTIAMVDTNSDPKLVDYPIPGNDDATASIEIITRYITSCIKDGLAERKQQKEEKETEKESSASA